MAITVEKSLLNNQSILQNFGLVEAIDAQAAEIISGGCCGNGGDNNGNGGWGGNGGNNNGNGGWGGNGGNNNGNGGNGSNRLYIC